MGLDSNSGSEPEISKLYVSGNHVKGYYHLPFFPGDNGRSLHNTCMPDIPNFQHPLEMDFPKFSRELDTQG